jgi:hypothetical protein
VHDVRNAIIVPIPKNFHAEFGFNFQMDPDYLAPGFVDRVKVAVDEAAQLGMNCWLKGDAGWPPGQALKIRHPQQCAVRAWVIGMENGSQIATLPDMSRSIFWTQR